MRAGVAPGDDAGLPGPELLREWRRRWDLSDADPPVHIFGKCRQQIAIPPEEILDIRDVIEHGAADDHAAFPHRMALEGEVARVCHAGHHVSDISAPHDGERVTIHCTVVDSSGR